MPSIEMIEGAVQEAASGNRDDYCSPDASQRKAGWLSSLATLPGIGATLLAVGLFPACWPACARVLSALGFGFLLKTTYLLPVTALLLLVAGLDADAVMDLLAETADDALLAAMSDVHRERLGTRRSPGDISPGSGRNSNGRSRRRGR
ncbi:MAG: hypothetical protein J7M40_03110 [Planctomycetes bacterium]|nr:hypothetical protein [Planctomycetota bacterium]